jgi:hypothetical protein
MGMMTGWRAVVLALWALPAAHVAAQEAAVPVVAPPAPPAPVPAPAPAPADDVVELKELSQLAQLCRDVKVPSNAPSRSVDLKQAVAQQVASRKAALERIYNVVIPADHYTFAEYSLEQGRMMVSTEGGFHTLRGALGLWSTDGEPLEVPMAPAAAQEAVAAQRKGELMLRLYVHLDADPDELEQDTLKGEPCATRPGTQAYQLAVSWLGGELIDVGHKKSLGTFATELGRQTPELAQRLLGNVDLRLGTPEGAGESSGVLLAALEGRRAALNGCHEKHGRHAEGGMVLGLDVAKGGVLEKVGIDVDSLGRDAVGKCVLEEVRALRPTLKVPAGTHITVPLVWGRE